MQPGGTRASETEPALVRHKREHVADPIAAVREVLAVPDQQLDYRMAKLALDRAVDPSLDRRAARAELDRLADAARDLAGAQPTGDRRLRALRAVLYESGPWNGFRPFGYDHSNLRGGNVRVKLISHYLETRLGDCVSMPVLFLILADELGLDVALAAAPLHLFIRYRPESGETINLETTGSALPARDSWLRQVRPASDKAIANGVYLRSLTRREGVAAMACVVLQFLNDARRYEEAADVAAIMIEHNPRDVHALANQGNAYEKLLRSDFLDKYRSAYLIPMALRPRYLRLLAAKHAAFARARALGWELCV